MAMTNALANYKMATIMGVKKFYCIGPFCVNLLSRFESYAIFD
jgi:hypothetical protein